MATGKQLIDLAAEHIGEKYVLGATVPFTNNNNYKGPWGNAEFISWVVYQASGIKIGIKGSEFNMANWGKDATKLCTKISISDAAQIFGAILFRSPGYKGTTMGHIVFSDGNGGTLEAKSSKDNVCRSVIKGRQWEYGLLVNGIDYELNAGFKFDYTNPPFNFYVTSPIMKHAIVEETKTKLKKLNIFHGTIDTKYDTEAAVAVSNYQKMKGLVVDGVLGKDTLTALRVKQYTTIEKNMLWFKESFGSKIAPKLANTPFDIPLIMAIAFQETGYVWSRMINKTTIDDLLLCCTGDTLDTPNRSAFPKNKAELVAFPQGAKMFEVAREALKNVGRWSNDYNRLYISNPNKFCRGYGIFQYDLQFFKTNPSFFLNKEWGNIDKVIEMAIGELKAAQNRIPSLKGKNTLTEKDKIYVAIAYNRGTADITKDFKQGHKNTDSGMYYGELIYGFYTIASQL